MEYKEIKIEEYKSKIDSLNINIDIWYKLSMIFILGFLAFVYNSEQKLEKRINKIYAERHQFYEIEYNTILHSLRNGMIKNDSDMVQAAARNYNQLRKKDLDSKEELDNNLLNFKSEEFSFQYLLFLCIPFFIIARNMDKITQYNNKIDELYSQIIIDKKGKRISRRYSNR